MRHGYLLINRAFDRLVETIWAFWLPVVKGLLEQEIGYIGELHTFIQNRCEYHNHLEDEKCA